MTPASLTPMEQLLAFADWERKHNPNPHGAPHVAEWAAAEIERLNGERTVLVDVLRECDMVISTLEAESTDENEALRLLLRAIKRLTMLRQADERDLLANV